MTMVMLEACCAALELDPLQVFDTSFVMVPIIGVVDFRSNILPLPAGSPVATPVPPIVFDAHRLAAVRWEARDRFELLTGSFMVFYADVDAFISSKRSRDSQRTAASRVGCGTK